MAAIPVVVGQGQYIQGKDEPRPLDPVGLMARAAERALESAGGRALARCVDTLAVVNVISYGYADAPGRLARALSLTPARAYYGALGGNTPVKFFNQACRDIGEGRAQCVMIAGAEAEAAQRRAARGQVDLDWPPREPPAEIHGDQRPGSTDLENDYDYMAPAYTYAAFENALRHSLGRGLDEHREALGALLSGMSAVAAENPYAWNREAYSPLDILFPTEKNRYVAYPYTIRMNPNIHVDQSACVILMSEEKARSLGVDPERLVYPLGGAELDNVWEVCRRPRLYDSPALRECGRLALAQAGLSIADVGLLDLYSCFASVVRIAKAELGIQEDDPRPVTVTGGLPFFGGPGSNYSLHGIATLADRIRADRTLTALATGLGWFNTKHAVTVLGGDPPKTPWTGRDDNAVQAGINASALPPPVEKVDGPFTVDAYTIWYHMHGVPLRGTCIGRDASGRRAMAWMELDPKVLLALQEEELVGKTGNAKYEEGLKRNIVRF